MRERFKTALPEDSALPRTSTFHSLGVWILSRELRHLGYKKNKFNIFDFNDQQQILFDILSSLKMDFNDEVMKVVRDRISHAKNNMQKPEDLPTTSDAEKTLKEIYRQYQESLKQFGGLDLDDLIFQTVNLLNENPEILVQYQKKIDFMMVDEYQDTNQSQYRMASLLTAHNRNLAVVGDDDQSIYSWRGADITNILGFENDFPDSRLIKLEENYRSTGMILGAANAVIKNNEERKDKTLVTSGSMGEKIGWHLAENSMEEARFIANEISALNFHRRAPYSDFAILYRTNSQGKVFEDLLLEMKIPFQVSGKLDFYDKKEIKDAIAYLKIMAKPEDDVSLLRVINYPKRGIGSGTLEKIKSACQETGMSLLEGAWQCANAGTLSKDQSREILHLVELLRNYHKDMNQRKMGDLFQEFLRNIGFHDQIMKESPEPEIVEKKLLNLDQLFIQMNRYSGRKKNPSVADFLIKLALAQTEDREEEDEMFHNSVQLLTIHAAKGLEYPYVFLAGFEEGLLPFEREGLAPSETVEERRLCYVAMTRAKKRLVLTATLTRRQGREESVRTPSRFLSEIPEQYLETIDTTGSELTPEDNAEDMGKKSFRQIREMLKKKSAD